MTWVINIAIFTALLFPLATFGQADFVPLADVPGLDTTQSGGIGQYINALYGLSITVAALLVVVKLIYAGLLYMLSEIVTNKEKAKGEIRGALFGLLIIISAVLVLNTINPGLTSFNILGSANRITPTQQSSSGTPGSGTTATVGSTITTYATTDAARAAASECGGTIRSVGGPGGSFQYHVTCP